LERRALQLGLRGAALRRYGEQELISIEDITPIVAEQRQQAFDNCAGLRMPEERLYRPADQKAAISVGIESPSTDLPAE